MQYFDLCQTDPQIQCPCCLSYCATGFVYCSCGICLTHTDRMPLMNTIKFDTMSIAGYVIKTGVGHGARHGKSEEQTFYHKSFNAWKRCRRHQDEFGQNLQVSLTDSKEIQYIENRKKRLFGRTLHAKNWTRKRRRTPRINLTSGERARYKSNWGPTLNSSGSNAPLASRPDFRAALAPKE